MNEPNRYKVLCPVERNGKTFWVRSGIAFDNRDGSTNIYLDVLPQNGRLQLRAFDEAERERGDELSANPVPL